MASSDKDVEEQLLEAGNKIVDPPTSVEQLLPLLDKIESFLARVEQSPSKSMQSALAPSLKALVSDQLLRHSDIDVKVAVAACISEITRITAPDAPYNDEQMKEVFHLIVSSFENLSDKSSRSYAKRASILETVAKVRSCVVMLDLECDGLIIEMFQHFLKTVRDDHPENVFSSMETIMSLVLEESEDISVELLSPILDSVKKDNEEILPIARKLGERVLDNCSTKLKPYLVQAVKTLGISFDDYSDVVASICKDLSGSLEPSNLRDADDNTVPESKSVGTSGEEVEDKLTEVATPERVDTAIEKHCDSVKSNGVAQGGEDGSVPNLENKKEEHGGHECKEVKSPKSSEPAKLGSEKASNFKEKSEKIPKKRGRKPNPKPTEVPHVDAQKGSQSQPEHESHSEHPGSPRGNRSAENLPSEIEADAKPSSPKAMEIESANVTTPSLSGSVPDECNNKSGQGKKAAQAKKKVNSAKEVASTAQVSKKSSDEINDSGAKPAEDKAPAGVSDDSKTADEDAAERESDTTSDSEAKSLKQSARKGDGASKSGGGSLKQSEAKRKKGSGKTISGKTLKKLSGDDDKKETTPVLKPTSKTTKDEKILNKTTTPASKRKRTPSKEKESDTKDFDETLVGSKIKVWWPKDRMFYEGVIDSFDPEKRKHKVLYMDGDQEILNLKKERWEFIDDDSESEQEQTEDLVRSESATETPQKKKAKINANKSATRGKMDGSPKKGGVTSSSKSKGATTKTDRSSGSKVEGKSKENTPRVGRPPGSTASKSKDQTTPKTGSKAGSAGPKIAGKSRNDDAESHKTGKLKDDETSTPAAAASVKSKQDVLKTGKSKQETPKTPAISKGKSPKTGDKSNNSNLSSKVKFTSSKSKESGDLKNSPASGKATENSKGKSLNSSNDQGSESKSGKKRRRESKG
ncbi:Sister chromatid cohesion protein PDS5-like A [Cucurbita argyrosperma subsp. argyrosperma]|nr:Sister chromatid cohesion protein PDS5-like A [Cucurbita argyrosperma subsp. argyrosperma]